MASIQARHGRSCALAKPWTPYAAAVNGGGCDCAPTFYVVVREGRRLHREKVGKNRQAAERALRKIGSQVDEDSYQPQRRIRFRDWGNQWRESLERKETTRESYASTIAYATEAFGDVVVRRLRPSHIAKLNEMTKERGLSPSTRAKHLRVLNACLASAVEHGYAGQVPKLPKAERPRAEKKEAAYFTNDELPRLFAAIGEGVTARCSSPRSRRACVRASCWRSLGATSISARASSASGAATRTGT